MNDKLKKTDLLILKTKIEEGTLIFKVRKVNKLKKY